MNNQKYNNVDDISMVNNNKTYLKKPGENIELDCSFTSQSGTFNLFSNPVLWKKWQPFELEDEEKNEVSNNGGNIESFGNAFVNKFENSHASKKVGQYCLKSKLKDK